MLASMKEGRSEVRVRKRKKKKKEVGRKDEERRYKSKKSNDQRSVKETHRKRDKPRRIAGVSLSPALANGETQGQSEEKKKSRDE